MESFKNSSDVMLSIKKWTIRKANEMQLRVWEKNAKENLP